MSKGMIQVIEYKFVIEMSSGLLTRVAKLEDRQKKLFTLVLV